MASTVQDSLDLIISTAQQLKAQLAPAPASVVTVNAGGNLQAALDAGGVIQLEDGATFEGNFVAKVPGTRLTGATATLQGNAGGPALFVPPGAKDIQATLGQAGTADDQAVILVGDSVTQTTLDAVPDGIQLTIFVPTFRGKRAFEINGKNVTLLNCGCADVFDPAGRDSQGILVFNTPGPVTVSGGSFEAASENILVGGDVTAIPTVVPTGLIFQDVTLVKRTAWMAAGGPAVKNHFELKAGVNVQLLRATLDGNWVSGQAGSSIVLTPRNGKTIGNVLLADVTVKNSVHAINMLAYDDEAYSPQLVGITFQRITAAVLQRFLQMGSEFDGVIVDSCQFQGSDTTVYATPDVAWDSPTASHQGAVSKGVQITNNRLACNSYGLMLTDAAGGEAYGKNWQAAWPDGIITGNTFVGSTAALMAKNLPAGNTFAAA